MTFYGDVPTRRVESSTSSEDLPPFSYQPLDKHQIRLLQIDSISEGVVKCTIINVCLEDSPKYYALSYCWGSGIRNENFPISEHLFKITPNLLEALREVHGVLKKCDIHKFCIWVDAICIDQDNADEKSVQVQQMDRVYYDAENVFIWLGREADQSGKIMLVLSWLNSGSYYQQLVEKGPESNADLDLAAFRAAIDKSAAHLALETRELKENYNIEEKNLKALQSIEEFRKR